MERRLEDLMLRVSQSPLIDGGHQDEAIRVVLNTICEGLSVLRAGVWFLDGEQRGIRCELLIDRANNTELENMLLTEVAYPGYFGHLYRERAIVADDARQDPATHEFRDGYLIPLGISSMLDVPIRHHGQMIGIICAEHTGPPRHWTPDEVTFAGGLADLIGRAINARANHEAREALTELNRGLERKVAERTAELEAAMKLMRSMQDELIQAEKLASLGSMVAGIAHELNTPIGNALTVLTAANDRAQAMVEMIGSGVVRRSELLAGLGALADMAGLAERSVQRAATLVTSFKQVAVDQVSERRRQFDLRGLTEATLAAMHHGLKTLPIRINNDVPEGIVCDGFPGALEQVFTNLVQNAVIHGFEGRTGGTITISANLTGSTVEFRVADDGVGMETTTVMRIFEPFFTTKLGRGGSGLGLSISYRIVTTILAGEIRVVSSPGTGTQFLVRFPLNAPGAI
jgi:signal transduction histidine kinase